MTKHILILIFAIILLYYLSNKCSCINNGFRVGSQGNPQYSTPISIGGGLKLKNCSGAGGASSELCLKEAVYVSPPPKIILQSSEKR